MESKFWKDGKAEDSIGRCQAHSSRYMVDKMFDELLLGPLEVLINDHLNKYKYKMWCADTDESDIRSFILKKLREQILSFKPYKPTGMKSSALMYCKIIIRCVVANLRKKWYDNNQKKKIEEK